MRKETDKQLELYLHIPFCVQKCNYCDFLSMPAPESIRRQYVDSLIGEIKYRGAECKDYLVTSVFIGGGTPSILPGVQIAEVMEALRQNFSIDREAEVTIECNPGTLTQQKLSFYKSSGINRLSMGLQSARNLELEQLGRIHTFEQFLQNYDLARKSGFENINIDIMSALPGQSMENWRYTLKKVLELRPEHISAYSLIVEEGTPFYERYGEDEQRREQGEQPLFLPDEETEREMYEMTRRLLEKRGYIRYEISNYAKPGKECRHNIGYWRRTPYLGLGLGSASLLENTRFSNTTDIKEYLKGDFRNLDEILRRTPEKEKDTEGNDISPDTLNTEKESNIIHLDKKQQMEEFMFLGLRMMEGISRSSFQESFGVELEGVYGIVIKKLTQQGLLEQKAGKVYLTQEGISVSNYVMREFLLDF